MSSELHPFVFDVNFNFGQEGLLNDAEETYTNTPPIPPVMGFFLFLNGGIFTLLNGQNLTLL